MRLGPLVIRSPIALQRNGKPRDDLQARAITGLRAYAGFIVEDYNPDVRGVKWFKVVDQMRNFSRIKAAEALFTLPLLAANPHFEAPADAGSAAKEAAALIQQDLFDNSLTPFVDLLRLALLARLYGVRLIEPQWKIDGDRVQAEDFRDLLPHTYYAWRFENQRPIAVVQQGVSPDTGAMKHQEIPLEPLLRFTWNTEGNNPEGRADARAAYADWFTVNFIDSVVRVAVERAGIGDWTGEIPRELWENADFRNEMKTILQALRSHKEGAVVYPEGVKIAVLEALERQGVDLLGQLRDRYVAEMSQSLLSGIFNVGMRDMGTSAWAKELMRLTVISLNGSGHWFCQNFCLQFVRKWIQFNYPGMPPDEQPRPVVGDAGLVLQPEALVEAVNETTKAGNLPEGEPQIQGHLASILGLPWQPPEPKKLHASLPDRIELQREREQIVVGSQIRQAEEGMAKMLGDVLTRQRNTVIAQAMKTVEAFDRAEPIKKGIALEGLRDLSVPLLAEYERRALDFLNATWKEAAALVARETGIEPTKPNWVSGWIEERANALAERHAAELKFAVRSQVARDLRVGQTAAQVKLNASTTFDQRATTNLADFEAAAREMVDKLVEEGVW